MGCMYHLWEKEDIRLSEINAARNAKTILFHQLSLLPSPGREMSSSYGYGVKA